MANYVKKRRIDKVGRIVIPKDMRDFYNFDANKAIRIVPTDDGILLLSGKCEGLPKAPRKS